MKQGAQPTNYYANAHFSIPNYFMITTGQIPTTDDNSTTVWNIDNIARRMLAANVTFKVYAEGIKQGYLGGNTGLYVLRHDPFAMLSDVANKEKLLPPEFIRADGFGITEAARRYLAPLIRGEAYPPYRGGLPDYIKLRNVAVPKQLAGTFAI